MKKGHATEGEHSKFRPTTNSFDSDQIVTTVVVNYCISFRDMSWGEGGSKCPSPFVAVNHKLTMDYDKMEIGENEPPSM